MVWSKSVQVLTFLHFDGHHDHIVIDHDEGLMPNGSLSIEARIKATSLDGIRFIP